MLYKDILILISPLQIVNYFGHKSSAGLVCQSDDECKTEAEMGAGWGSFYANQPNAPCLDMTNFGMDGMVF